MFWGMGFWEILIRPWGAVRRAEPTTRHVGTITPTHAQRSPAVWMESAEQAFH